LIIVDTGGLISETTAAPGSTKSLLDELRAADQSRLRPALALRSFLV
jgi:hypothetical protein